MGIRLTGISTPFGGINWEYKKDKLNKHEDLSSTLLKPQSKIKVFISSICGVKKYDDIRKELKEKIERTQLADVYVFERKEGSTLTAEEDYIFALRDSDVCIFLIDNKDGVNPGVQREIDVARNENIKSLYYFCNENCKEKTAVEQSIMGAEYAKSRTVNKFSELAEHGAQALIDDIVKIFRYYCSGMIVPITEESDNTQKTTVVGIENITMQTIPKTVIKNVDKCKEYILRFVLNAEYDFSEGKTNELDDWGNQFLPILFEGKPIKQFNTSMYLEHLKGYQSDSFHKVVEARWRAIQSYYAGRIDECMTQLQDALQLAKDLQQPEWVVKDILIDIRNHEIIQAYTRNTYADSDAQKELSESEEELYYPIIDRINESLHEKYIADLFKERIKSPFSVSIGNDMSQYGDMLASSYIVSLYNGSLTHLRRIHDKIKNFSFFLCDKYDNWIFRRNLMLMEIYNGEEKEVTNTLTAYPEILNNMTAEDAQEIMSFCDNHPLEYRRIVSKLIAFGVVGYYLNEDRFIDHSNYIIGVIKKWLESDNPIVMIGDYVFPCLEKVSYRMDQNELANICCLFIEKQYSRWYRQMFRFIAKSIELNRLNDSIKNKFINHIVLLFNREKEIGEVKNTPGFLCCLRKQDKELTKELDQKVQEHLPDYYEGTYKLETTDEIETELPAFINKYVQRIEKSNKTQGLNGVYYTYATRDIATIRAILINNKQIYSEALMDSIIHVVVETLLYSKEGISEKTDAVSLLICIILNYPNDYKRNIEMFTEIYDKRDEINIEDVSFHSSNIHELSMKISLDLLLSAMGYDVSSELMENLSYLQDDLATTISVTNSIIDYIETSDTAVFPAAIQNIILQNALLWIHSQSVNIRWNSVKIMLGLLRSSESKIILNHQLIHLVDTESLYIKNMIMRNLYRCDNISETSREYIISKCEVDPCFVVRKVCEEEKAKKLRETNEKTSQQ